VKRFAISCLAATFLLAAGAEPRWQMLNRAAAQAAKAKDYAKLRQTLLELKPLLPGNPTILYNLAAASVHLGDTAAALSGLRNLAQAGLIYEFASDAAFTSLRGTPDFAAIIERVNQNKQPISHSTPAFTLPESDLIPEDIAYNPKTRRFLIASVRESKVVQTDGITTSAFAKTDWPVLALRIDTRRGIVWAASGWLPQCAHCSAAGKDRTALLAFDLNSGALRKRVVSPVKGLFGDMTISREGDVYVSEGIYGALLRLPAGASRFERLDIPGEFPSPQTPALSADEKTLYIPDYARGIAAMTLSSRAVTWMQPADDIALSGIDGLYLFGDSFIAVQNGTTPARIVRFSLDLHKLQILDANTPELGQPSHGTLVGETFYFLANTGWDDYDDAGKKKAGTAPVVSTIRKINLQ
jgi:sugar lactone lactonase YvrE